MAPLHDVDVPTKKATFSMACFWEPDAIFGVVKGVIRTRVGYAGGKQENPTYKRIGDHTETIDVDYDPINTTYSDLLELFWKHHDPTARNSRQYTSFIFYHDDEQKALAEASLKERQSQTKSVIVTQVLPAGRFYDAEFYHQKYRLQQHPKIVDAIGLKQGPMLLTSHVAARLNGYVVGFGGIKNFEEEQSRLGISDDIAEYVKKLIVRYQGRGPTC